MDNNKLLSLFTKFSTTNTKSNSHHYKWLCFLTSKQNNDFYSIKYMDIMVTKDSLFIYSLSKAFMKSVKSLLKIDLSNQLLSSQSKLLERFNISPLILRIFSHYCTFTFNNVPSISRYLHESKHVISIRNHYSITKFRSNHKKFSFSIIAAKLLNEFIHNLIVNKTKISSFKTLMFINSYSYYDKLHIIFGHNESYFIS